MNTRKTAARIKPLTANVGVVAVGHRAYWPQFDGLLDEMVRKLAHLVKRLQAHRLTVTEFGMVDCAEAAYEVVPRIKAADLDLLFVDMVTYATSSTFGVMARSLDVPIVLVALQPLKAMDYARGTTFMQLCNDDFCSVSEFLGVALRMGKRAPDVILGRMENDPASAEEIARWCRIARALHDLKRARIGHMGHVLEAMLDMHTDPTAVTAAFGCHVAQVEPDDVMKHFRPLSGGEPEVQSRKREILDFFDTPDPVSDPITHKLTEEDLDRAARASVALDRMIAEKHLDGLAYYYEAEEGSPMRELMANLIVGNSLLTSAGFPMCGEHDIKTCVAMLIMDRMEMGGSFAEFHPIDFERDTVLVGHDGPHHINIADRKPVLRSLKKYHGKPGSGASVEFNIRTGPITILSIGVKSDGHFKFVIAEGESLAGPIPPTGNTNTHGRFKPDVRTFLRRWVAEGPTHHFALGVGHRARELSKVAEILGIDSAVVTD
jgi:L-arabinose isomerase